MAAITDKLRWAAVFAAIVFATAVLAATILAACVGVVAAIAGAAEAANKAASPEKPVAGRAVHFPSGTWSGLPKIGPDKKVQQCVLVAARSRAGPGDAIETHLSLNISRGSGLAFAVTDDRIPSEDILDDQAEIVVDGKTFPAVAFAVGSDTLAIHPGDAAAVLSALDKAATLRLRSDGDGVDTGAMALELPGDALGWLKQCGKLFDIAIDRPTDLDAPELPAPRPRAPEIASGEPTAAGPAGIEDKQNIAGWDASELRGPTGTILVCMIRRHYAMGSDPGAPRIGTFLMVSRAKGLTMMLKDSSNHLPPGEPVDATLAIDKKPFGGISAQVLGGDEIGIFPQHGAALAQALAEGAIVKFRAPKVADDMTFPVQSGVVPWLRACARRHGIGIEPADAKP